MEFRQNLIARQLVPVVAEKVRQRAGFVGMPEIIDNVAQRYDRPVQRAPEDQVGLGTGNVGRLIEIEQAPGDVAVTRLEFVMGQSGRDRSPLPADRDSGSRSSPCPFRLDEGYVSHLFYHYMSKIACNRIAIRRARSVGPFGLTG